MLFAELRGWRTVMDAVGPPLAQTALARAVDHALEALIEFDAEDVTLDGDRMQPVVSATFAGPGHALRAVRAAVALRQAVAAAQSPAPAGLQFQACTGVNSGEIVELALGEEDPISLRSVGTLRSFAARLREFAGPGQVLLSAATYAQVTEVAEAVSARSVGEIRTSGYDEKQEAFSLTAVTDASSAGNPSHPSHPLHPSR